MKKPEFWTDKELSALKRMAKQGYSSREAARAVGRPYPGTKYKAMREGIRFHSVEQPVGIQSKIQRRRFRKRGK